MISYGKSYRRNKFHLSYYLSHLTITVFISIFLRGRLIGASDKIQDNLVVVKDLIPDIAYYMHIVHICRIVSLYINFIAAWCSSGKHKFCGGYLIANLRLCLSAKRNYLFCLQIWMRMRPAKIIILKVTIELINFIGT